MRLHSLLIPSSFLQTKNQRALLIAKFGNRTSLAGSNATRICMFNHNQTLSILINSPCNRKFVPGSKSRNLFLSVGVREFSSDRRIGDIIVALHSKDVREKWKDIVILCEYFNKTELKNGEVEYVHHFCSDDLFLKIMQVIKSHIPCSIHSFNRFSTSTTIQQKIEDLIISRLSHFLQNVALDSKFKIVSMFTNIQNILDYRQLQAHNKKKLLDTIEFLSSKDILIKSNSVDPNEVFVESLHSVTRLLVINTNAIIAAFELGIVWNYFPVHIKNQLLYPILKVFEMSSSDYLPALDVDITGYNIPLEILNLIGSLGNIKFEVHNVKNLDLTYESIVEYFYRHMYREYFLLKDNPDHNFSVPCISIILFKFVNISLRWEHMSQASKFKLINLIRMGLIGRNHNSVGQFKIENFIFAVKKIGIILPKAMFRNVLNCFCNDFTAAHIQSSSSSVPGNNIQQGNYFDRHALEIISYLAKFVESHFQDRFSAKVNKDGEREFSEFEYVLVLNNFLQRNYRNTPYLRQSLIQIAERNFSMFSNPKHLENNMLRYTIKQMANLGLIITPTSSLFAALDKFLVKNLSIKLFDIIILDNLSHHAVKFDDFSPALQKLFLDSCIQHADCVDNFFLRSNFLKAICVNRPRLLALAQEKSVQNKSWVIYFASYSNLAGGTTGNLCSYFLRVLRHWDTLTFSDRSFLTTRLAKFFSETDIHGSSSYLCSDEMFLEIVIKLKNCEKIRLEFGFPGESVMIMTDSVESVAGNNDFTPEGYTEIVENESENNEFIKSVEEGDFTKETESAARLSDDNAKLSALFSMAEMETLKRQWEEFETITVARLMKIIKDRNKIKVQTLFSKIFQFLPFDSFLSTNKIIVTSTFEELIITQNKSTDMKKIISNFLNTTDLQKRIKLLESCIKSMQYINDHLTCIKGLGMSRSSFTPEIWRDEILLPLRNFLEIYFIHGRDDVNVQRLNAMYHVTKFLYRIQYFKCHLSDFDLPSPVNEHTNTLDMVIRFLTLNDYNSGKKYIDELVSPLILFNNILHSLNHMFYKWRNLSPGLQSDLLTMLQSAIDSNIHRLTGRNWFAEMYVLVKILTGLNEIGASLPAKTLSSFFELAQEKVFVNLNKNNPSNYKTGLEIRILRVFSGLILQSAPILEMKMETKLLGGVSSSANVVDADIVYSCLAKTLIHPNRFYQKLEYFLGKNFDVLTQDLTLMNETLEELPRFGYLISTIPEIRDRFCYKVWFLLRDPSTLKISDIMNCIANLRLHGLNRSNISFKLRTGLIVALCHIPTEDKTMTYTNDYTMILTYLNHLRAMNFSESDLKEVLDMKGYSDLPYTIKKCVGMADLRR